MNGASEHDLDVVLAALRDVQPSSGFEQRVLARVEQGVEGSHRRGWFWPLAVVTAAVVVCVGVGYHHATRPTETMVAVAPVGVTSPGVAVVRVQGSLAHGPRSVREPEVVVRPSLSAADQAALDNTMAPSQVAPPAPLTAEERMLLRSARRNDQVNMAQLEALPRFAARDAEDGVVAQFVRRNLASLAFAESFHPTLVPEPAPTVVEEPQGEAEAQADAPQ